MYRYQDIIVIDFEGFKGKPLNMVGIWEKYDNRNQPYYRVIILDQDLKGLVDITDLRASYVVLIEFMETIIARARREKKKSSLIPSMNS